MYYARDIKGAVLFSSSFPPPDTVIGPFSLGTFSYPDNQRNVSLIIEQPSEVQVAHILPSPYPPMEHAAIAVDELVGIEYRDTRGVRLQFYVSPEHGSIPIVARKYRDDTLDELAVVTDVRKMVDGHFFPMRTVFSGVKDGNPADTVAAIETRVLELNVGEPVDPSLFQMQIAAGSVMRDGMNFKSQFHIDNARTVTLDDLDDLFAQAAAAAVQRAEWDRLNEQNAVRAVSAVSATPQPRTVGLSLLVYATSILVVIAVAVLLLKRYLRQRH